MNYRKITKPAAAMTLSFVMAAGSITPAIAASNTNKEENIYPRLFTAIPCEVAEIHVITVF